MDLVTDFRYILGYTMVIIYLYQVMVVNCLPNITWTKKTGLSNRLYHGYSYTANSRSSIHCTITCGTSTENCLSATYDRNNMQCYTYDTDVTTGSAHYDVISGCETFTKTIPISLADICLTPYIYDQLSGICYRIEASGTKNFDSARAVCESEGARLICLNTVERLDFINDVIRAVGLSNVEFWVGADDYVTEGRWVCPDGNLYPMNSTFWIENEPSNSFATGEQCGILKTGRLNDGRCARTEKYICEKVV